MIETVLIVIGVYLAVGILVSVWLLWRGIQRHDADLAATPWRTKLILVPGCAALWPLLLIQSNRPARERAS